MSGTSGSGRPGGRLDHEAYFNAALRILADRGFAELTVDNLCAELGATKGSFYHHFAGMPDFVQALADVWEAAVTAVFTEVASLPPSEAFVRSMEILERWPVRADVAMRTWGWADPVVGAAVRRHEAAWEQVLRTWIAQFVSDPERCRVLAHMHQAILTGMGQLQRPADLDLVRAVLLEFARSNLGLALLPDATGPSADLPDTIASEATGS
jgi:AcrR family transcriptional regulator